MKRLNNKDTSIIKKIGLTILLPAWVAASFLAVQFLLSGFIQLFEYVWTHFNFPTIGINSTLFTTVLVGLAYVLSLGVIVFVPAKVLKNKTTKQEVGLKQKWPNVRDFGLAPLALIASLILSAVLMVVAMKVSGGAFNIAQEQAVPFDRDASYSYFGLLMVFVALVVMAPFAEELMIRGYLYGKLRKYNSAVMTILITSLLFGALHLGFGKLADLQWNVAINTFAMALFLGWLREYTGSVWSGIIVHVIKNFIAFVILFAVPFYFGHLFG